MGHLGEKSEGEHVYMENLWREKTLYIYIFFREEKVQAFPNAPFSL
jgi:hypothetical protein